MGISPVLRVPALRKNVVRGGRGITGPQAAPLVWLLYDEFTTDESAPLASPRTCEPGPGTLTAVETDGTLAISSGELVFTAQSTPSWGDLGFHCTAQTRDSGLGLHVKANLTTWEECGIGWHGAAAVADPDSAEHAIQANTTNGRFDDENATPIITGLSASTDYNLLQVLRSVGCHYVLDGELLWVDDAGATSTLYPMFAGLDGAGSLDDLGVVDLPANGYTDWDADFSTVTDSEVNQASKNYDCDANCHVTGTVTCENGKYVYIYIRYTDADNWVRLAIGTDRVVKLQKNVATSTSTVATGSTLTDAVEYKYDLVANGSAAEGFIDNVSDVSGTIADHATVAQGRLEHDLASNDLDVTSHPTPALGIATDRVIGRLDTSDTADANHNCLTYFRNIELATGAHDPSYAWRYTAAEGNKRAYIVIKRDGALQFGTYNAGWGGTVNAGAGTVSDGDDVAVVLDEAYVELFVNGTSVGSSAAVDNFTGVTGFIGFYETDEMAQDSIEFFPRDVSSLLPSKLV